MNKIDNITMNSIFEQAEKIGMEIQETQESL